MIKAEWAGKNVFLFAKVAITNKMIENMLRKEGFQNVFPETDEKKVLEKVKDDEGILIIDWAFDKTNGAAFLEKVREVGGSGLKILIYIEKGIKDLLKDVIIKYDVAYGFKPFTPDMARLAITTLSSAVSNGKKPPAMNVNHINPFIEVTQNILKDFCFTEVKRKSILAKDNLEMFGDISGIMALSGEANGFVIVSMSSELAFKLVHKMTMGDVKPEENEIIEGGLMELINMISGHSQAAFTKANINFDFTTPTLVKGKNHTIVHGFKASTITVLFTTLGDFEIDFAIQICLK